MQRGMSACRRAQERQAVAIWEESAARRVKGEARVLRQRDTQRMPVEPAVEETEAARIDVHEYAFILERGQVEGEAFDVAIHNTDTSGDPVYP
jgi:hypothetical protein